MEILHLLPEVIGKLADLLMAVASVIAALTAYEKVKRTPQKPRRKKKK